MSEIIRETLCLPPADASPQVCIFSSFNEKYAPLADIARPNWKAYAERHGYGLRFYPNGYHEDPSRPETYGDKGRFECYYDLRGHVDIAMYLDIDSLFMNMDVRVEDVLTAPWQGGPLDDRSPMWLVPASAKIKPEQLVNAPGSIVPFDAEPLRLARPERRFLWSYDDGGPLSGLWIARTDDTTEKHLRAAYTYAAENNNVRHGKIEPNGVSDQDAMRALMHVPPFRDTFQHCYPAEDVGHCYPKNYKPGKWIITFPGRSVEEKLEGMKRYVDLAGQ